MSFAVSDIEELFLEVRSLPPERTSYIFSNTDGAPCPVTRSQVPTALFVAFRSPSQRRLPNLLEPISDSAAVATRVLVTPRDHLEVWHPGVRYCVCVYMYVCVCVCLCACARVCVCVWKSCLQRSCTQCPLMQRLSKSSG